MQRSILKYILLVAGLYVVFTIPTSLRACPVVPTGPDSSLQALPTQARDAESARNYDDSRSQQARKAGKEEKGSATEEKKVVYRREVAEYVKTFYIA